MSPGWLQRDCSVAQNRHEVISMSSVHSCCATESAAAQCRNQRNSVRHIQLLSRDAEHAHHQLPNKPEAPSRTTGELDHRGATPLTASSHPLTCAAVHVPPRDKAEAQLPCKNLPSSGGRGLRRYYCLFVDHPLNARCSIRISPAPHTSDTAIYSPGKTPGTIIQLIRLILPSGDGGPGGSRVRGSHREKTPMGSDQWRGRLIHDRKCLGAVLTMVPALISVLPEAMRCSSVPVGSGSCGG